MSNDVEKVMSLAECRQRIAEIRALSFTGDFEAAHIKEDDLICDVLTECLMKSPDSDEMASLVLALRGEDRPRWAA
jgi:hypothetical protein